MAEQTRFFDFLMEEHKRGGNFWEAKKLFDLTHQENKGSIRKTRQAIPHIADTAKLLVSKYSIERSQGE